MAENGQKYHPLHDDLQQITERSPEQPSSVWGTLGMLANMVRSVTGRSRWSDSPPTNLTDAKTHHDRVDNPHSVTRGQLGAAAATALDSHTADRANPHGVTAAQAGARPATWVPGWNEVTGKPVSFPSSWSEVAGKPSVFAPTNHNDRHRAGGLDPLTASDVGAAPSSHVGSGGSAHPAATTTAAGFMSGADKAKLSELVSVGPGLSGNGRAATPVGLKVYGFSAVDRVGGTNQAVVYATDTKVPLMNEVADVDNCFDSANSRYVAPAAGRYVIYAGTRFSQMADQDIIAVFVTKGGSRTAGAEITTIATSGTQAINLAGSNVLTLAAGDVLELWVRLGGSAGTPQLWADYRTYMVCGFWGA